MRGFDKVLKVAALHGVLLFGVEALADKTKVTFTLPSGNTVKASRLWLDVVKDFEAANPDIKVEFNAVESFDKSLEYVKNTIQANKSPGVFVLELSETQAQMEAGNIVPFDMFLDAEAGGKGNFVKQFVPGYEAAGLLKDGKLWSFPFYRSSPIAFYNLDAMASVGFDAKKIPKNWTELEALLVALNKKTGKPSVGMGEWWTFEAYVQQNNGSIFDEASGKPTFDSPAVVEVMKLWQKWYKMGLIVIPNNWRAQLNGFIEQSYPVTYFSTGGIGSTVNDAKFKWNVAVMAKNKVDACPPGGANIFVGKNLSEAEGKAAWKLIKYMINPKTQALIWSATGFFPVTSEAYEDAIFKNDSQAQVYKIAKEQLSYVKAKNLPKNYNKYRKILQEAIDDVLKNGKEPADALKVAQEKGLAL